MLSPDPVIDWLLVEALTARVRHLDAAARAHAAAVADAHERAQQAVREAVS